MGWGRPGPLLALLLACINPAFGQDDPVERGRAIFLFAAGVEASVGSAMSPVSGPAFACKNCHGMDAAGKREGTVQFPPIGWQTLSAPTASRPAYDGVALGAAVTAGMAPGGRPLSQIMPRYKLGPQDIAALAAFLQGIEAEQRSGVSSDEIVFAVPASDRFGALASGMADALNRQFAAINSTGGVYDRRLRAVPLIGDIAPRSFDAVFATLGLVSDDAALEDGLRSRGVPVVFPFSPPMDDTDRDLLQGGGPTMDALIAALVARAARDGDGLVICHGDTPFDGQLAGLAEQKARALDLAVTTAAIAACPSAPAIMLLASGGALETAQLPSGTETRLYGLLDQLAAAAPALRSARYRLILANPRPQLMHRAMAGGLSLADAQAAAIVPSLTSALLNSGRAVTRARFMAALDPVLAARETAGETVELLDLAVAPDD